MAGSNPPGKPSEAEIEKAHNDIAQAYITAILELMALSGQDEVNFMKKSVSTPEGGVYLLQFQHVSGPKIRLSELFRRDDNAAP